MSYKIGCALKFNIFTAEPSESSVRLCEGFGGREALLKYLGKNIDTVELHMIKHDFDPDDVLNAVKELNSYGITATIHGALNEVALFFAPYEKLFAANVQPNYNITVHFAKTEEDTERMLRDICKRIDEKKYPVYITLENQRIKEGKSFGVCSDVERIVKRIASKHLGCCFDFGHQLSNERKFDTDSYTEDFIALVRHTHIHSMYEGRTHFPLCVGETKLEKNLTALFESGFDGVLSLELSPDRYDGVFDLKKTLIASVEILKAAARQTDSKLNWVAYYKNDYLNGMRALKARFDAAESCIALVGHSGLVIKLKDIKIAVDIAPCVAPVGEEEKAFLLDFINGFDVFILTHAHCDHYDKEFFSRLSSGIKKFVPDFMKLEAENTVKTFDGAGFSLGNAKLCFFESGHSRENSIVAEYGFYLEYNGEKYLFPIDVRNYDFKYPVFDNVRILFANLWLGKGQALKLYDNGCVDEFCRYVNKFGAKETKIAHLYDVHRTIDEMWSDIHFELLKDKIENASVFKVGDLIEI